MEDNKFYGLITADQNLIHQQNIDKFNLFAYVIKAKDIPFKTILPLVPKIISAINSYSNEKVYIIE